MTGTGDPAVLAISTSSAVLSLALTAGDVVLRHHHAIIGRGHAEALVPALAEMLGSARATAILVDVGPGSFTGIRIGIAAARALALAWDVPVSGCTAVGLVAARAFALRPGLDAVTVLLDAGRDMVLRCRVTADWRVGPLESGQAPSVASGEALAGSGIALLGAHGGDIVDMAPPDAAMARHLPAGARALPPTALYVRPPDAIMPVPRPM